MFPLHDDMVCLQEIHHNTAGAKRLLKELEQDMSGPGPQLAELSTLLARSLPFVSSPPGSARGGAALVHDISGKAKGTIKTPDLGPMPFHALDGSAAGPSSAQAKKLVAEQLASLDPRPPR